MRQVEISSILDPIKGNGGISIHIHGPEQVRIKYVGKSQFALLDVT